MEKKQRLSTQSVILTGMFAAVLAVLSQISIPMPSGVPVTLQTFAVALTGYVLGWKFGLAATAVYVLLGAVGVPVFAGFSGGIGVCLNMTGGFIWGFLFMAALCGLAMTTANKALKIVLSAAGLVLCHLFGVLQFMAVMGMKFTAAAMMVSVPYLVKDVISVALAYVLALAVRRALRAAGAAALA